MWFSTTNMELMYIDMGVIRKIWNVMGYYSIPPKRKTNAIPWSQICVHKSCTTPMVSGERLAC